MTRALLAVALLAAAAPARAEVSFDASAAGAEHVSRLDDLVWALTATCTAGDDTEQRQCRRVRDARAAELAHETLLVDAEPGALEIGAWNAQRRSVSLHLTACIRCGGVTVGGASWQLLGAAARPGGATPVAATLYDGARTFPDEAAAQAWIASLAGARVELLVKLAPPAHAANGAPRSPVIAFDVLGYRVVTPCDGAIVIANPTAAPLPPDKTACAHHAVKVEK